jgi:hypothetical protein
MTVGKTAGTPLIDLTAEKYDADLDVEAREIATSTRGSDSSP